MRDTEHFKKHLSVRTQIDNKTTGNVPVEDPFHHTTVVVGWNFWDWLKMLFSRKREVEIRVKVCADGVAIGRWFQGADICEHCKRTRIDGLGQHAYKPGYEHADERWCEACYYGHTEATATISPPPPWR
jgi:hypothetical protein